MSLHRVYFQPSFAFFRTFRIILLVCRYSFAPSASYRSLFNPVSRYKGREYLRWPSAVFLLRFFLSISLCASVTAVYLVFIILNSSMSSSVSLIIAANFPLFACLSDLGVLTYQGQSSFLTGLAFLLSSDKLGRSSLPGQGHFLCLWSKTPCPLVVSSWLEPLPQQDVVHLVMMFPI